MIKVGMIVCFPNVARDNKKYEVMEVIDDKAHIKEYGVRRPNEWTGPIKMLEEVKGGAER